MIVAFNVLLVIFLSCSWF